MDRPRRLLLEIEKSPVRAKRTHRKPSDRRAAAAASPSLPSSSSHRRILHSFLTSAARQATRCLRSLPCTSSGASLLLVEVFPFFFFLFFFCFFFFHSLTSLVETRVLVFALTLKSEIAIQLLAPLGEDRRASRNDRCRHLDGEGRKLHPQRHGKRDTEKQEEPVKKEEVNKERKRPEERKKEREVVGKGEREKESFSSLTESTTLR